MKTENLDSMRQRWRDNRAALIGLKTVTPDLDETLSSLFQGEHLNIVRSQVEAFGVYFVPLFTLFFKDEAYVMLYTALLNNETVATAIQ